MMDDVDDAILKRVTLIRDIGVQRGCKALSEDLLDILSEAASNDEPANYALAGVTNYLIGRLEDHKNELKNLLEEFRNLSDAEDDERPNQMDT